MKEYNCLSICWLSEKGVVSLSRLLSLLSFVSTIADLQICKRYNIVSAAGSITDIHIINIRRVFFIIYALVGNSCNARESLT